ncbi:hypothetical protein SAMN06295998_1352 [Primorskyibacter flagellatus]|uniref:Uncharacterized protein n=1 Tax=Primorskyibacter flagellatus TaxID=1387277 RepID=A0A1W2ENQ8_9RHOB|nr:hypothetical protein SAMN06295998_1352 [Primorskyibacter flagellatus]
MAGNSRCTLWDERPFILRTKSEMAIFGGTDTNMWTWSHDSTPRKMSTSFSRQTWRQMSRTRRRSAPVSTL